MKTLQKRILFIRLALFLSFFCAVFSAKAGANPQSVFNSAVDQINCETIRFIHREAGRAEIANNMQCFSFESILKSIPDDETQTTAQLAKDIEAFKRKFKPDDDMDAQLDAVIKFAANKIERKPRKGNVADFKQKLEGYKTDALQNISGSEDAVADDQTAIPDTDESIEDEADAAAAIPANDSPEGKTDWLGWLSLLLALGSLGFSAYIYSRLKNVGRFPEMPEERENRQRTLPVNESEANYSNLEAKMYEEIARISQQFDEKLGAVTASTGYTQPETFAEEDDEIIEDEDQYIPATAKPADEPIPVSIQENDSEVDEDSEVENASEEEEINSAETSAYKNTINEVARQNESVEENTETESKEEEPEEEKIAEENDIAEHIEKEEDIENEPDIKAASDIANDQDFENEQDTEESETVNQNTFRSDIASAPVIQQSNNITENEEDEDATALPEYRYLGLPMPDGSFSPESFTDAPAPESMYEVEMYEDVPNKAFFSPLQYAETIEKALTNPQQYLEPCCTFLNEAEGKLAITVIEEGRLRRQGDRWYIYEKAKIRFD